MSEVSDASLVIVVPHPVWQQGNELACSDAASRPAEHLQVLGEFSTRKAAHVRRRAWVPVFRERLGYEGQELCLVGGLMVEI